MGKEETWTTPLVTQSLLFGLLLLLSHHTPFASGIELHFEPKDGGFFIRPLNYQQLAHATSSAEELSTDFSSSSTTIPVNSGEVSSSGGDPTSVNSQHFTVLPSSSPVSIRVVYGPFSTKQTVPIRLLVPDPLDGGNGNASSPSYGDSDMMPPMDLSAHIVTPTIPKDTPILRVLFHAGQTAFGLPISTQSVPQKGSSSSSSSSRRPRTRLCLVAQATRAPGDVVTASCSPDSRDSTCLAELTLPIHWWPDHHHIHHDHNNSQQQNTKPTKIHIQVSYAVYEPENGHCNEIGLSTTLDSGIIGEGTSGSKRIQIQPLTPLATVALVDPQKSYRVVKADGSEAVKLLVPQGSIYPHAKFYVPLILGKHEDQSIVAFIMRARVKSGLRILGIEPNIEQSWNITTDFNPRRTHATITAVRKYDPKKHSHNEVPSPSLGSHGGKPVPQPHPLKTSPFDAPEEVFNWILEAGEEAGDDWDGGRVVWILRYVIQPPSDSNWNKKDPFSNFSDERHKLTTRLEIQKDDIQAVLPIAKSWEVVNTAVLNGKQVSRPMKIFIVSRAGQVADVTLQASCRSLDESVLKVSSSCTSVYVDGSEIRGSTNATISIKYGTYEGNAQFIVWMPEFPLDIQVSDAKLNQIKGWRVPGGGRESHGKRDVSSKIFDDVENVQEDQSAPSSTTTTTTSSSSSSSSSSASSLFSSSAKGPLVTDPNYYYGPTLGDGEEEDLDLDPWDENEDDLDDEDGEDETRKQKGTEGRRRTTSTTTGATSSTSSGGEGEEDDLDLEIEDKYHCRGRYQHTRVDVYGRFLAQDQDSGRTSYFISRKTFLKITDLVSDYLRVVDGQVAVIKGATPSSPGVQGVGPGRTEIQVVSPVTGRVLGTKEIRVVNERVTFSGMKVQVISGVQLSLFPDNDVDNQFVAETSLTSKLSAKYQEALLDIKLRFSDNTWVKLDEIEKDNYILAVDSLEPSVVELPPIQNSKYPRIIAVTEGGGPIMRISLELSDQCHRQHSSPLAMAFAPVEVNFTATPSRSEFTQNDSNNQLSITNSILTNNKHSIRKNGRKERKKDKNSQNSPDITGIPLKDDSSKAASGAGQGSHHLGPITVGFIPEKGWTFAAHNTPLEIAMYALLCVFSVAILVFVASCFVYASRVKKRDHALTTDELMGFKMEPSFGPHGLNLGMGGRLLNGAGVVGGGGNNGGATNAHDWVWLGRASLALHPSLDSTKHLQHFGGRGGLSGSTTSSISNSNNMRIITNPNFDNLQQTPSTPGSLSSVQQPRFRNSGGELAPPPRPPKPSSSTTPTKGIDSSTFSVAVPKLKMVVSPDPPEEDDEDDDEVVEMSRDLCPDYRPPVPPHRNIPQAPPSGPTPSTSTNIHNNLLANNPKPHCSSSTNPFHLDFCDQKNAGGAGGMSFIDEESEMEDYEDEGGIKRPLNMTVAAAASSAIAARQNKKNKKRNSNSNSINSNNSSVKLDMDYDQLMEYFDNLKETEA